MGSSFGANLFDFVRSNPRFIFIPIAALLLLFSSRKYTSVQDLFNTALHLIMEEDGIKSSRYIVLSDYKRKEKAPAKRQESKC